MKTKLFIVILLTVMAANTFAQAQKVFVRTIELNEGTPLIELITVKEVEVIRWNEDVIRVVTNVNTPYITKKDLQAVAKSGRYTWDVDYSEEEDLLLLELTNLEKAIRINEVDLEEKIDVRLYLPIGIEYLIITPLEFNLTVAR